MYMGLEYFFSYVPLIIFILFYSVTEELDPPSMKFKIFFLLIFNIKCFMLLAVYSFIMVDSISLLVVEKVVNVYICIFMILNPCEN